MIEQFRCVMVLFNARSITSYCLLVVIKLTFDEQELLEQMSEQDYSEHVVAVKTRLSEKPKKLSNETVKHWAEISCRQYDFHRGLLRSYRYFTIFS